MRILHFSDIHLPPRLGAIPWTDWLGKRLVGGANLLLGRGRSFSEGFEKMVALDRFRREQGVDFVICTGDYTGLGTLSELRAARDAVAPLMEAPLGYAHVPGNHDVYVLDALRQKRFERHFGDSLDTDLPQYLVEGGRWPFVRLVGDDVAVVGVNSARPNPQPWRSSGRIPDAQLERLQAALADSDVQRRFVFVITHYASRLEDGRPDHRRHGLVNADAFLEACADVPRGALLCGHVHRRYCVRMEGVRPPLLCAGSTTKAGAEGLWVFDVDGDGAQATPGAWRDGGYVLDASAAFSL